jgi:hypothetical protein
VRGYIVWRVLEDAIDWFCTRRGRFRRLRTDARGIYRSEVFPGLWLDASAMLKSESTEALQVLQQGIASPEHAAFVKRLARTAATKAERKGPAQNGPQA